MASEVGGKAGVFKSLIEHRATLTGSQSQMVASAPPEQRAFLVAQFKLQNEMELTQQITNMLKTESRMAIARNL